MAALYLHQALFAPEPSVPPVLSPSPHVQLPNRQLSSVSTVTLRTTSHSDHSHPTEALLSPVDTESSAAYLDLLSRQPHHPSSPGSRTDVPLNLEGDPMTPGERRSRWERRVRRRLRRLRWTKRTLLVVIGAWAIYNSVRYYLAFTIYKYHDRQIILLTLGTSAAVSLACIILSLVITLFAPHLGWIYKRNAPHAIVQALLNYSSSALLFGPAVVNFVFVFLWRRPPHIVDSLRGRCHWDIDVFWSGLGAECEESPAWDYWLAGAIVRLVLTGFFLFSYHLITYQYDVTRQPSRRRRRSRPRSGASSTTATSASSRSFQAMTSTGVASPVSIAQIGRQPSLTTSEGHTTSESFGSAGEHRPLRPMRSRISSQSFREVHQLPSALSLPRMGGGLFSQAALPVDRADSPDSEEDIGTGISSDWYGQQVRRIPGAYASPLSAPSPGGGLVQEAREDLPQDVLSDTDLSSFADRFRALVADIARETEEGIALAQNDRPGQYAQTNPGMEQTDDPHSEYTNAGDEYVPVLGRTIHRMPTIESLGSREVMSLASDQSSSSIRRASPGPHHLSRPSTRSNNLSLSEVGTSTPSTRSRANSLDAALALAPPAEDVLREDAEQDNTLEPETLDSPHSSSDGDMVVWGIAS